MMDLFKKKLIPVTTTIPAHIKEDAKRQGVTIQSLVIQGWNARQGFPALLERQRELETKVAKLSNHLDIAQASLWKAQQEAKERKEK